MNKLYVRDVCKFCPYFNIDDCILGCNVTIRENRWVPANKKDCKKERIKEETRKAHSARETSSLNKGTPDTVTTTTGRRVARHDVVSIRVDTNKRVNNNAIELSDGSIAYLSDEEATKIYGSLSVQSTKYTKGYSGSNWTWQ